MEELRVFIKTTIPIDGEIRSAWFDLPIDEDEFMERLGVDAESTDFHITEKEVPFPDDVSEDTTIERLNDLYDMYEDLPVSIKEEITELLVQMSSLDELHQHCYDIIHYPDCNSMIDVARHVLAENPAFASLSEDCVRYFDFEAYGDYLDENGTFVETEHGIYEMP